MRLLNDPASSDLLSSTSNYCPVHCVRSFGDLIEKYLGHMGMEVMVSRETTQFPGFTKSSDGSISDGLPGAENWNTL